MNSRDNQKKGANQEENDEQAVIIQPVIFSADNNPLLEKASEIEIVTISNDLNCQMIPDLPDEISVYILTFLDDDSLSIAKLLCLSIYISAQQEREKRLKKGRYLWSYLISPDFAFEQALKSYAANVFQVRIPVIERFLTGGRRQICQPLNDDINKALINKRSLDCLYSDSKFSEWLKNIESFCLMFKSKKNGLERLHLIQYIEQAINFLEDVGQLEELITLFLLYFKIKRIWKGVNIDYTDILINPAWSNQLTGKGLLLLDDNLSSVLIEQLIKNHERILHAASENDVEANQARLAIEAVLSKITEDNLIQFFSFGGYLYAEIILSSSYFLCPGKMSDTTVILIIEKLLPKNVGRVFANNPAFIARLNSELLFNLFANINPYRGYEFIVNIFNHPELIKKLEDRHTSHIISILAGLNKKRLLKSLLGNFIFFNWLTSPLLASIATSNRKYKKIISKHQEAVKKLTIEDLISIAGKCRLTLRQFLKHPIVVKRLFNQHLIQLLTQYKPHAHEIVCYPELVAKLKLKDLVLFENTELDALGLEVIKAHRSLLEEQDRADRLKRKNEIKSLKKDRKKIARYTLKKEKETQENTQEPVPAQIIYVDPDIPRQNKKTNSVTYAFLALFIFFTLPITIPLSIPVLIVSVPLLLIGLIIRSIIYCATSKKSNRESEIKKEKPFSVTMEFDPCEEDNGKSIVNAQAPQQNSARRSRRNSVPPRGLLTKSMEGVISSPHHRGRSASMSNQSNDTEQKRFSLEL